MLVDDVWQSDACNLEDGSDLALDGRADDDGFAIFSMVVFLETVEITQEPLPFGRQAFSPADAAQFFAEYERQERTCDLDRGSRHRIGGGSADLRSSPRRRMAQSRMPLNYLGAKILRKNGRPRV